MVAKKSSKKKTVTKKPAGKRTGACGCSGAVGGVVSEERLEAQAVVIKALAHKSRLAAVQALAGGEKCVCDLKEIIGSGMSTVSEHLSILKRAGLITERKKGLYVYYSLAMPCVTKFIDCIDEVLGQAGK